MKIYIQIVLSFCLIYWTCIPVMSQDLETTSTPVDIDAVRSGEINALFTASNEAPLIGEPFNLTLQVITPPSYQIVFPELSDLSPLEIITSSPLVTEVRENQRFHQRDYQVVIWETGTYLSPEIAVEVIDPAGSRFFAPVDSFFVTIPATLEDPANQSLRPFMPPIRLPESESQLIMVIVIGVGLGFVSLIVWGSRRRSYNHDITRATATTRVKIQDLRASDLDQREKFNLLAVIIREYLVHRLNLEAMEMTTSEIANSLSDRGQISKTRVSQLRQILDQCDIVKFTKMMPDEAVTNQYIDFSLRWVTELDQSISRSTDRD